MMTLVPYTKQKLTEKKNIGSPFIKIISSGTFYIYARISKKLGLEPGDAVLFSEDPKKGTWYISKDPSGINTYTNSSSNNCMMFHSSVLRQQILKAALIPAFEESEVFYLDIDDIPILQNNKIYYRIKLML